tara:strand:+ start:1953 stop:2156 length:204 start_codon:yes stop_codon:yes gene_type:complete
MTSERVPSIGTFTNPGFSIRPVIDTSMNFGERPYNTEFGMMLGFCSLREGINIESPSNNLMSFLASF